MIEPTGLSAPSDENLDGDIEIEAMELRPVEKLYEERLNGNNPKPTT